jgi:hypothetical protein
MESRVIQLTSAAHKHGNLNIRTCGKDFFPPDVFGGSSKKKGLGVPITIEAQGLPQTIQTDIPTNAKGKPRWLFRERTWVKDFISSNELTKDQMITIERINYRTYKLISDNNHKEKSQTLFVLQEKKQPVQNISESIKGDLIGIKQASEWATEYLGKKVTTSNISYLIQYGLIKKIGDNGTTLISKQELLNYYKSYNGKRQVSWKDKLGDDLNWALSFDQYKEAETTKHVH